MPPNPEAPSSDSLAPDGGASLIFRGFDTETIPFSQGDRAPKLVCVQWKDLDSAVAEVVTRKRGAIELIRGWLLDPHVVLVAHNASYDLAVLCREGLVKEVFAVLRAGRAIDTWAYERLGEIAGYSGRKKLDLGTCMQAHGLQPPSMKGTSAATEFGQFIDADEIPEPHLTYALEDTFVVDLFKRQAKRFRRVPLAAAQALTRRHLALQLSSVWGMRVDTTAVDKLQQQARHELDQLIPQALEMGFIRWGRVTRKNPFDGARQTPSGKWTGIALIVCRDKLREVVTEAYDGRPPMTTKPRRAGPNWKPQVSTDALTLAESGDPDLETFSRYNQWSVVLSKDVPMLRNCKGIVHTSYTIVDTLRTGSRDPGIQNWTTKQGGPQVRECVHARPGHAIISIDYSGLELASFAQNAVWALGDRRMADKLNSGIDLHSVIGARIKGVSYEEFLHLREHAPKSEWYRQRQSGKGSNFGFQGGMRNIPKFCRYCASNYNLRGPDRLSEKQGRYLYEVWQDESPTQMAWLKKVRASEKYDGTFDCELPGWGVVRRGVWYNAACNNPFQALGAWVCSEATWALTEAMYEGLHADLRDCRIIGHIHDEWLIEVPFDRVAEVDVLARGILTSVARRCMPDVKSCVPEACAMLRWSKGAKEIRNEEGELQVWQVAA